MVTKQNGTSPATEEAQQRATAVVLAYRAIDWDAVKAGDEAAVRSLVGALELHDAARRFLQEEDCGELGQKLDAGLERYYGSEVAAKLGDPLVVLQLTQLPAAIAAQSPATAQDDGLAPRSRPQVTVGHTVRMNTGCGHLYVTVNESEDGKPFELFNHMGKAGGCAASQNEAIGRLISYALRCGAKLDPLIKQLKGISCHRPAWGEDGKISSCSDAIGKALEKYHHSRELREQRGLVAGSPEGHLVTGGSRAPDAGAPVRRESTNGSVSFESAAVAERWVEPESAPPARHDGGDVHRVQGACVDCGSQLSFEEGCVKCHSCGFTECG